MGVNLNKKTIYLSGAMLDCTDAECRDWREFAKQNLNCATLDPMMRDMAYSRHTGKK